MAGYLGSVPVPQATQHRETFTATAAQTSFATAGYTPQFVDVYLNGVHLSPADVTATNGSDVVLTACLVNDIIDVVSYTPFEVADQTFTGTTTMSTTDNSTNLLLTSTDADDAVGPSLELYRNSGSPAAGDTLGDISFFGENAADAKHLYARNFLVARAVGNGSESGQVFNRVLAAGTETNYFTYGINSDGVSEFCINEDSLDVNFRVESNNLAAALFVDGANGRVGINNAAPPDLLSITSGHINLTAANSYIKGSGHNVLQVDNTYTYFYGGSDGVQTRNAANDAILMNITDAGIITKPLQPAFFAKPDSNGQANIATGSVVTVKLSSEIYDLGGNFVATTGDGQGGDGSNLRATFTAPVTGKYQFNANVRIEDVDSAADFYELKLETSNRTYQYIIDPGQFNGDMAFITLSINVLADMDASDTAILKISQPNGTAQTDINSSGANTNFSGYLVC